MDHFRCLAEILLDTQWTCDSLEKAVVRFTVPRSRARLLFSGSENFGRLAKAFAIQVGSIVKEEGFQIQFRKTRIMRAATRQTAAGIVLNRCTNLNRFEYDRLKATLCNCARLGPSTQNRNQLAELEAHLRGRVNWVRQLHPARGEKLAAMFGTIDWSK